MNRLKIRQVISNCLFMAEFTALFFLICAVVQGSISLLPGLGYGLASFFGVNLVSSLILCRPAKTAKKRKKPVFPAVSRNRLSLRISPDHRRTAA